MSGQILGGLGIAQGVEGSTGNAISGAAQMQAQGDVKPTQNYAANHLRHADWAFRQAFHPTPVRAFHEAFDHPVSYDPKQVPDLELRMLRLRMLGEEFMELARAFGCQVKLLSGVVEAEDRIEVEGVTGGEYDPVEAADALGDLRYITDGTNLVCGFPGEIILHEIHNANMAKLGPDGKPIKRADGKVLKPEGWQPPQESIRRILFGDK